MQKLEVAIQKASDIGVCFGVLQTCIGLAKIFNEGGKIEEAFDCCRFADEAATELFKRIGIE